MRKYQSASSISTFLSCPHAYDLHYNRGIEGTTNKKVEIGSWVHKQLENSPDHHVDANEFVAARDAWLKDNEDEILTQEQRFEVDIPEAGKFIFIVDALTRNGIAIDYKVSEWPKTASNSNFYAIINLLGLTYSPLYLETPPTPYYAGVLTLQMRLYKAMLSAINMDYSPMYLILRYKILKRKAGDYLQFVDLVEDYPPVTPMMEEYSRNELVTAIKMIAACEESGVYPASMNGCGSCFYKEHCDFYSGH